MAIRKGFVITNNLQPDFEDMVWTNVFIRLGAWTYFPSSRINEACNVVQELHYYRTEASFDAGKGEVVWIRNRWPRISFVVGQVGMNAENVPHSDWQEIHNRVKAAIEAAPGEDGTGGFGWTLQPKNRV